MAAERKTPPTMAIKKATVKASLTEIRQYLLYAKQDITKNDLGSADRWIEGAARALDALRDEMAVIHS